MDIGAISKSVRGTLARYNGATRRHAPNGARTKKRGGVWLVVTNFEFEACGRGGFVCLLSVCLLYCVVWCCWRLQFWRGDPDESFPSTCPAKQNLSTIQRPQGSNACRLQAVALWTACRKQRARVLDTRATPHSGLPLMD